VHIHQAGQNDILGLRHKAKQKQGGACSHGIQAATPHNTQQHDRFDSSPKA
jgi:hypothetical protein